ncbi:mitochondrial inner membrane protease ATP23 homolog isoform X2 [Apodemus sylvaticus]|uniref:mitochondrial inner membrane protease ATP23 homolog isoform X2 n=1 Tax=Apodemus sylvaticus TaxID=10129 RepID=UPI002242F0C3|nr:mitochondrial inner membrane protease ATP23 homolog isoform X2 [Apodemus sylvaticus]
MAGSPGGGEPGPAAGEPLLQRPDSGQGSPEPPAHGNPQQGFLSSLFTRDQSCPLMLQKTLETNPYVKLLLDAMKHSGCALNRGRHFSCEVCDGNLSGGFDASTSQIVLCENNIRNQAHMGRVVTHELIHAFDHCRAHVHWFTNIRHLACSEAESPFAPHRPTVFVTDSSREPQWGLLTRERTLQAAFWIEAAPSDVRAGQSCPLHLGGPERQQRRGREGRG